MKMLFIHDNRFWKYEDKYYSYGHFAYDLLWKRYMKYFDNIVVGGRISEVSKKSAVNGYSVSSGENVSFFSLPNLMSVKGLTQYKKAKQKIKEKMEDADCVVIRLPSNLGYLACKIAEEMNINYVVEVVGCTWDDLWNYGSLIGKIYAPISFLIERKCVKKAPNALYVSKKFLQNRYPNKNFNMGFSDTNIMVNDNCVLKNRLSKIDDMNGNKDIRIGLIASLNVGYKGHDTAIYAMQEVLKKHKNIKLCFLGDGDTKKWKKIGSECKVLNNLEFSGSLPGGKPVLNWLDNIDIFIMPSLQETLGRALIEAMSRACPSLGGAGTAVSEQLGYDCIHDRKNYHELSDMICYMIEHPKYMKLCAVENYERSKKYSEEILLERRDYFWKNVLKK